ncbi:MAG: NAD(P)/FAD-dependent oxidoreductase [Rhodospirillaceae bacterium]|jgi:L-2-hydroxyglutarate oxidase LhgO|nr:NAD(P)/FAD-dependent oxidoreductase [Rhodospirillaceae bacterium]MBT6206334.1 NAD(P)/FAD-dependent oxidoreductase [Rhodospirillaceae bacterium]MBT6511507.1 NAD(P)/FAD-dependent oxidoreductase [Rhodospirillaceae bacterium]MBT7615297.1 NAD(P)/FAD-dependent oxidoreductase [Rhodospirillaceae bacterium]MBT7649025.1 NAD(P)/FAD-dependent oxidoreductase [Rhodospirillaceae bacterium]
MESVETVVVGAGVVGLAIARALALSGREVIVLEAAEAFGTATSSRNSEVIHAGIYYPTGSLKARLCVAGKWMLYEFCVSHGVDFTRFGKLIVATEQSELEILDGLKAKAAENGVEDLIRLDAAEVAAREPELRAAGALLSPSTGVVDSHGLMTAYLGDAEAAGAMLALHAPVESGEVRNSGIALQVGGEMPMTLYAREVINAAGLGAPVLGKAMAGLDPEHVPERYMAKGNYYTLSGRSPFSSLIYPVPMKAGLGVHVTLDLGGQCRFGPDVEWVDEIDYEVDPARADVFYEAVRRYWPGLQDGALQPGYSGIRPKLQLPGGAATDFMIEGPGDHGVPGLVNLFGIESPGLTSSLAIAEVVRRKLDDVVTS